MPSTTRVSHAIEWSVTKRAGLLREQSFFMTSFCDSTQEETKTFSWNHSLDNNAWRQYVMWFPFIMSWHVSSWQNNNKNNNYALPFFIVATPCWGFRHFGLALVEPLKAANDMKVRKYHAAQRELQEESNQSDNTDRCWRSTRRFVLYVNVPYVLKRTNAWRTTHPISFVCIRLSYK
jgi:hypothetical protein